MRLKNVTYVDIIRIYALKNGWWCICVCSIHNFSLSFSVYAKTVPTYIVSIEMKLIRYSLGEKKHIPSYLFIKKNTSQLFPYITLYPIPSMEISGYRLVIVQSRGILQMWHNLEFALGKDFSSKACESMAVKGITTLKQSLFLPIIFSFWLATTSSDYLVRMPARPI